MTSELQLRCTGGLLERIIASEREMVGKYIFPKEKIFPFNIFLHRLGNVASLLPLSFSNKSVGLLQYRDPFRFTFAIHCHSLLEDFREDLEFRFTFGLTSLIRRFMRLRSGGSCASSSADDNLFGSTSIVRATKIISIYFHSLDKKISRFLDSTIFSY